MLHLNMKASTSKFDPSIDEPEFDLHAAYERNKLSYRTIPAFRQMIDRLFKSPQRVAEWLAKPNPFPKR